ncbi:MAG: 16S rRNA (cytidine(1402)-2'-O)-methyltransferase [Gammaproteobacteria bacterium]|jgi:16S rRNA (cytidine1402-2'-O)-methyltransferase
MSIDQDFPSGALFVVGTPIGNVADLSERAGAVLALVDVIAAEDTRRTRGLLTRIGAKTPLIAYHDHNEAEVAPKLIERLRAGERVAVVADAGMPTISDPGMTLVALARRHGLTVVAVPGPCAATAALSVSGLPSDRYCFEGFLPRRAAQRLARLEALRGERRTMIFYESVHRIGATLAAMAGIFGGQRRAAVVRELTKLHESCHVGTLAQLSADEGIEPRGEFVIVVTGAAQRRDADDEVMRIYAVLAQELEPKRAVAVTARLTGRSRNEIYRLAHSA